MINRIDEVKKLMDEARWSFAIISQARIDTKIANNTVILLGLTGKQFNEKKNDQNLLTERMKWKSSCTKESKVSQSSVKLGLILRLPIMLCFSWASNSIKTFTIEQQKRRSEKTYGRSKMKFCRPELTLNMPIKLCFSWDWQTSNSIK